MQLQNIYFNITGPDGAGKDSILSEVLKTLQGYETFREPGGTVEAEIIRGIILCIDDEMRKQYFDQALNMDLLPITKEYVLKAYDMFNQFKSIKDAPDKEVGMMEAYLYAASRNETNNKFVIPMLKEGKTVIGSRSVACSMAYQANARNLGFETVWAINKPALTKKPDFEIYLDVPTDIAMERLSKRTSKQDRIDNESYEFHKKSREGYLKYYEEFCTHPVYKVDASGNLEENIKEVMNILNRFKK
ncbi:dTMP kinase [Bacillus cereus]|uniref:dTMP kinase n=1 Tax=Bacillus cereus TaxID=1396 RepID=UPI000B4AAA6A|nr:dTMP kinase [Bacillus cereus]